MKQIRSAAIALLSAGVVLAVIFLISTAVWILITDWVFADYFIVLSKIIKNSGTYATLFATVVAAVAFQSFKDAENKRKESEEKIKQIGQYSIAFRLEEKQNELFSTCGDIIAINEDKDFNYEYEGKKPDSSFIVFPIQFLTSGKESANLQCIMAFEEEYFNRNQKKIIKDYYGFCERQNLPNPIYCAARQTDPSLICEKRNRFINLLIQRPKEEKMKFIWIAAITDQGYLLFIKIKLRLIKTKQEYHCRLISQFSYAVENGKIKPLYY